LKIFTNPGILCYVKKLVIIPISLINLVVNGTNYYVKNSGKDNNTGLSDALAWQTISKVNASSFNPGDTIFFKKGDVWREALTIPSSGTLGHYIVFTSYSIGAKPQIFGSTQAGGWSKVSGNIWVCSTTLNDPAYGMAHDGQTSDVHGNWPGGTYFIGNDGLIMWGHREKTSQVELTVEYDWWYDSNHIYIYSPTDPTTRYSSVEVSQRQFGINTSYKDYVTIDGLEFHFQQAWGITDVNLTSRKLGLIVTNCTISHLAVKGGCGYGVLCKHSNSLIQNNTISECGRRSISMSTSASVTIQNIIIENNTMYNGYHTTGVDIICSSDTNYINNIIIRNNLVYDPPTNDCVSPESFNTEYCFISDQSPTSLGHVSHIYVHNNIFKASSCQGIHFQNADHVYIYNNTFYGKNLIISGPPLGIWGFDIMFEGSKTASVDIKNNLFFGNAVNNTNLYSLAIYIGSNVPKGAVNSDYNLFYQTDPKVHIYNWLGTNYTISEWAAFRTASGQEEHSIISLNPLFFSSSDYHLQQTSPAINKGLNVGLTTDYEGSPISGLPEIGAFEAQLSSNNPPPVFLSSTIEDATPSRLEMIYSLSLANIIPPSSAFGVQVNSAPREVNVIAISGTKVLLTLASEVVYSDIVTVAYTKPATNPLQTTTGGQAKNMNAQTVFNNVNAVSLPPVVMVPPNAINTPPVVVVNYTQNSYSGFVNEINASDSYDANNDKLSYEWVVPGNVHVSSINNSKIQYLSPMVDGPQTVEFTIKISDGKITQAKIIPVGIFPYQLGLEAAEVLSVEASSYSQPDYPHNVNDGDLSTMWSANGLDQWLLIELKELFSIQYLKLAFRPGQKNESYFNILGSDDKETWEPILIKSASCGFSGDPQVFDFPPSKAEKEFKFVKLTGQGNPYDNWNYISEIRIFGHRHRNQLEYESLPVKLYPNPAKEIINIRIDEPNLSPDFIKIINLLGKVVFQEILDPQIREFQLPVNLKTGIYIVQMGSGDLTLFTQKLIIASK
jgi:hypothetical protein